MLSSAALLPLSLSSLFACSGFSPCLLSDDRGLVKLLRLLYSPDCIICSDLFCLHQLMQNGTSGASWQHGWMASYIIHSSGIVSKVQCVKENPEFSV
ncbi:hypothetical protein RHSIM_Rhsim03G0115300 [Rhododendron simsii]|uniref:Secreted protein n=1 Tax=Rhododendron simsii TaxID=118357 RepID=A0A834HCH5_RHOSS|nr:hypothetical protein RHSIM_Rhsim03G0115300 [Rhododendron simsii]